MTDEMHEVDELPAAPRKEIAPADHELLALAARAMNADFEEVDGEGYGNLHFPDGTVAHAWNSLVFSGDAFDLAARLEIDVMHRAVGGRRIEVIVAGGPLLKHFYEGDRAEAVRWAVTNAAAEIIRGKRFLNEIS